MPGRKEQELRGLRFTVVPHSWLHRVLKWPFYFESTNYSFRITIERIGEDDPKRQWPETVTEQGRFPFIHFAGVFEGPSTQDWWIPVPDLAVGERTTVTWREVYISNPGQVRLGIVVNPGQDPGIAEFYSYRVRPEEALWLSAAVVLFATLSLIIAVAIPVYTASVDDPPIVNNNFVVPTPATSE